MHHHRESSCFGAVNGVSYVLMISLDWGSSGSCNNEVTSLGSSCSKAVQTLCTNPHHYPCSCLICEHAGGCMIRNAFARHVSKMGIHRILKAPGMGIQAFG